MSSKKAKQDVIICIGIYVFLILAFLPTISMRNGAELMPRLIIGLAAICNTISLIRTLRAPKNKDDVSSYALFSDMKVPLLAFLGMVVYAIVIKYTNYFIATAIMLPVFFVAEKIKKVWLILLIDVIYLAFIYFMFVIVLKVPMI